MIYTRVITNVGDVYDVNTGLFYPPVSGLYQLSMSVRLDPTVDSYFYMYVSNQNVCRVAYDDVGANHYESGACSTVVELTPDDTVYVQPTQSVELGQGASYFSGHLIHAYN